MVKERYDSYIHIDTNDGEQWSQLAIRVLQQSGCSEILKPRVITLNGADNMVYPVDGLLEDASMGESTDKTHRRKKVDAFIDLIRYVENSEFLKREFILLGEDSVFWNYMDNTPRFLVVPIEYENAEHRKRRTDEWEQEFIHFVLNNIDLSGDDNNRKIIELCEKKKINEIIDVIIGGANDKAPENVAEQECVAVTLKYQGAYGHFALYDDREPIYKIGKTDACQGVISFNPTVSREHCAIEYDGQQYFIMDLNSSNGTYLNRERLTPNSKRVIHDGDTIVISNMGFVVNIG